MLWNPKTQDSLHKMYIVVVSFVHV